MRSAFLSVLSILLILAGVLVPVGFESAEGGGLSLVLGRRAFAYHAGDGVWATSLGEGESRSFEIQAALPFAPIPMENLDERAPGDADPEETGFRFTYTGSDPVMLYLTTQTSGGLATCDGGDKFRIIIRDEEGNLYSHNEANQEVRRLDQGDEVTFRTVRQFDLSAGNDCQNKSALFSLQATVVQLVDDPPPVRPPTNPPPSSPPETPRGSITVRVIDGTNGASTPLNGATVTLPDGTTGQTNEAGEIIFPNLILGSYLVRAEAEDPLQPGSNNMASGSGTVSVDQTDLNPTITIVLAWQRPLTPPTPQPPSPPTPTPPLPAPFQGSIRVTVLDGSPHTGGLPVPIPNATVQLNGGQTRPTDPTGVALFEGLQPGEYTVWVEARNPRNPSDDLRGGSATVRVTREEANADMTVLLVWDQVSAPPGPTGPAEPSPPPGPTGSAEPSSPPGPTTPPSGGRGLLAGRICAPGQPGAEVVATTASGKRTAIFIGADGTLGQWRPYLLENLEAGDWEISLQAPGSGTARQKVTVKAGETTQIPDFTLACTGEAAPDDSNLWTYLVGGLLMAAGLVLRRYAEAK